jgi:putative YphP/YqiW family bacilliredoxin
MAARGFPAVAIAHDPTPSQGAAMYPAQMTDPIREEVHEIGLTELKTPAEVDAALSRPGTALVFVNSICGCAAGGARPGLFLALQQAAKKPDQVTTVFAGVDKEATAKARAFFAEYPPSSPSAALLKDGEVVWMLHRHQIEGRHPEQIAQQFKSAFETNC